MAHCPCEWNKDKGLIRHSEALLSDEESTLATSVIVFFTAAINLIDTQLTHQFRLPPRWRSYLTNLTSYTTETIRLGINKTTVAHAKCRLCRAPGVQYECAEAIQTYLACLLSRFWRLKSACAISSARSTAWPTRPGGCSTACTQQPSVQTTTRLRTYDVNTSEKHEPCVNRDDASTSARKRNARCLRSLLDKKSIRCGICLFPGPASYRTETTELTTVDYLQRIWAHCACVVYKHECPHTSGILFVLSSLHDSTLRAFSWRSKLWFVHWLS